MPTRIRRRADPFASSSRIDGWKKLTQCHVHLLDLVQNICPRLFEKRTPLFSQLNRIDQRDAARDVWHFTDNFQRRVFTAQRVKIESDGLGQLQLCDPIIVLRGDQ